MVSVILLMAGKGTRMKENINKVLLPLGDKMIFQYPLSLFVKLDFEVICVISKGDEEIVRKNIPSQVKLVYGGNTRQESVYNGLMECTGDYVLIHDAARAFISLATINKIIENKNNNKTEVREVIRFVERTDTLYIEKPVPYEVEKRVRYVPAFFKFTALFFVGVILLIIIRIVLKYKGL